MRGPHPTARIGKLELSIVEFGFLPLPQEMQGTADYYLTAVGVSIL